MPKRKKSSSSRSILSGAGNRTTQAQVQEQKRRANQTPAIHEAKTKAEEAKAEAIIAYKTLQVDGSAVTQRQIANFGTGFDIADNAGAGRSDITLDPSELSAQAVGCFKAVKIGDQLNIVNNVDTKITFPSATFDVSGWYDTSNSRYLPLRAGYYRFNAAVFFTPAVADARVELNLRVNGVHVHQLIQVHSSSIQQIGPAGTAVVFLDGVDDFVEIYMYHTFGITTSDVIAGTGTYFSGEFIGTA